MGQCIFCKIVNGDLPSYTVFENNDFKVILDAFPSGKGHVLILLKEHVEDVFSIDGSTLGKAHGLAGHVAKALKKILNCDGVNILQNNGASAGQTVFHYHIHVIPRFEDDTVNIKWQTKQFSNEENEEIRSLLASEI